MMVMECAVHIRIWIDFCYLEIMGLILLSLKHAKLAWDQESGSRVAFFLVGYRAGKVSNIKQSVMKIWFQFTAHSGNNK